MQFSLAVGLPMLPKRIFLGVSVLQLCQFGQMLDWQHLVNVTQSNRMQSYALGMRCRL
jgi:hypothetical protein